MADSRQTQFRQPPPAPTPVEKIAQPDSASEDSTKRFSLRSLFGGALRWMAVLLAALLLLEGVFRVGGLGVPPRGPDNNLPLRRNVPAKQAPLLGDTLKPNSSGEVLYPGWPGRAGQPDRPDRVVRYEINSDSFRDSKQYQRPKPQGVFRVAILGDSVTYGTGVQVEETYAKQLESLLARGSQTIEVMNCGVYAHNTSQQVAWLKYNVLPFEPDLVLIVATITDASGRNIEQGERDHGWEKAWIEKLGLTSGVWDPGDRGTHGRSHKELTMFLRRHSRLIDYGANRLYSALFGRLKARSYFLDWAPDANGFASVRSSLERAKQLGQQHDFRVAVSMFPTLTTLNESHPFLKLTTDLGQMCSELELPFCDLFPPFQGQVAEELHVHAHDRHPNAQAHRMTADALLTFFMESNLLPQ